MKASDAHPSVSPFNTPAIIKARALFVLQFIAMIGCLACAEAALAEQAWRLLVPSALCLALMVAIRAVLKRSGQWEACVNGLNRAYTRPEPLPGEEECSMRLMELIDRRDEIESRRGTPEFDPWALQEVRHEINELVKAKPSLAELLDDEG
jgi:hypothetical protein